ncbi:MAG: RHS repeat-associated core domain-containing protein, partial [Anaerolineae bacterium]|nr:RHS repeat-associated core domain-containing protein [Anaerolineae bacterium]
MRQTLGSDTTHYLWDELSAYGDVVRETNGTGTELANYTLANQQLIAQVRGGAASYYVQDGQGSTRALTNATGDITDTYNYLAYGQLYGQTGTTTNSYLYTGQQFDSLTGLYSLRARYYDPSVGRFVSRDTYPINYQNPIELNRYGYTANNPINRSDPSGRFMEYAFLHADKEVVGGTIGGATGGFAFSTFLYVLGMLNPFIGWCGGRGTSKLQEWAWLLTAHNQVFDFI